jgi:hypothetical protein
MKSSYCHATLRSSKDILAVIKYPCTRPLFYPTNIVRYCQLAHRSNVAHPLRPTTCMAGQCWMSHYFCQIKQGPCILRNITFDYRPSDRLSRPTVSWVSSFSCSFKQATMAFPPHSTLHYLSNRNVIQVTGINQQESRA